MTKDKNEKKLVETMKEKNILHQEKLEYLMSYRTKFQLHF